MFRNGYRFRKLVVEVRDLSSVVCTIVANDNTWSELHAPSMPDVIQIQSRQDY